MNVFIGRYFTQVDAFYLSQPIMFSSLFFRCLKWKRVFRHACLLEVFFFRKDCVLLTGCNLMRMMKELIRPSYYFEPSCQIIRRKWKSNEKLFAFFIFSMRIQFIGRQQEKSEFQCGSIMISKGKFIKPIQMRFCNYFEVYLRQSIFYGFFGEISD